MHKTINNRFQFSLISMNDLDVEEYNSIASKRIFTTFPWISFVQNDSKAEPVFVRITTDDTFVGYFTGAIVKKFGIRILGSPFNGWSTCHMGIDSDTDLSKCDIIRELIPFLFKELKCRFIEIIDRDITVEDAKASGFYAEEATTLTMPIDMDDDALFARMKPVCRTNIRQFERRGARLEIAEPNDSFAEQYYSQLEDVFAKQGMVPTYSLEKVKCLLRSLAGTGSLLCLRVISPDDRCIATSIYLGYNRVFYFWGGASYRSDQNYRPNEYMFWSAIRYWRERGFSTFDMCGVRDYKRKLGSTEDTYAQLSFSRPKLLIFLKNAAKSAYFLSLKIKGKLFHKK